MTVNESLVSYSRANKFTFPQKHKLIIGALVAKEFRSEYGLNVEIHTIMSAEEYGTFKVLDYPDHFRFKIDEIVHEYVVRLKQSGRKKTNEKPLIKTDPARPISYSSDPPKRQRKRIPIKTK